MRACKFSAIYCFSLETSQAYLFSEQGISLSKTASKTDIACVPLRKLQGDFGIIETSPLKAARSHRFTNFIPTKRRKTHRSIKFVLWQFVLWHSGTTSKTARNNTEASRNHIGRFELFFGVPVPLESCIGRFCVPYRLSL